MTELARYTVTIPLDDAADHAAVGAKLREIIRSAGRCTVEAIASVAQTSNLPVEAFFEASSVVRFVERTPADPAKPRTKRAPRAENGAHP